MELREYNGVFYNLEDFDVNGKPYTDAVTVKNGDTRDIFKQDVILRAQMADDEQPDNGCTDSCDCLDKYIVLFTTNPNEYVKYDSFGFKIQDDVCHHHNKIYNYNKIS